MQCNDVVEILEYIVKDREMNFGKTYRYKIHIENTCYIGLKIF